MSKRKKRLSVIVLIFTMLMINTLNVHAGPGFGGYSTQSRSSSTTALARGIQTMLLNYNTTTRAYIWNAGGADGSFGAGTESGVRSFQVARGLSADGICGVNTWRSFDNSLTKNSTSGSYIFFKGPNQYFHTYYNIRSQAYSGGRSYNDCYARTSGGSTSWYGMGMSQPYN